ncbi:MAG: MFS transporter [Thermocrispum sp.]
MTTDQLGPAPAPDDAARKHERRGWYFYDWANSTFYTSVITVFGAAYVTSMAQSDARNDTARNGPNPCPGDAEAGDSSLVDCDIGVLGLDIAVGSLWPYLIAVATIVQLLVFPLLGGIADRTQRKKQLLGFFAFLGALATCSLVFVTDWEWALPVYIVAQVGYGASIVIYYSFLADVADADERDEVSARGWAFGFLGGFVALGLQLVIYEGRDLFGIDEGMAVRICFLLSGLWWAGFTLIPLRRLKDRPSPRPNHPGSGVVRAGFAEIWRTIREAKAYPLTLAFLGAYLVFNDGIQTVVTQSAHYGKETLGFEQDTLITTILLVQFVAFVGGWLHGLLARRFGAKPTMIGSLCVWILVIVSAYFLQPGDKVSFYLVGAGIGIVLGGTVALSRSLYSQMIPAGKEAQYFSMYEITERGTAWIGPQLFGAIGAATGSFRPAILALAGFFVVGIVLVALVPVRRAIVAAGNTPPEKI